MLLDFASRKIHRILKRERAMAMVAAEVGVEAMVDVVAANSSLLSIQLEALNSLPWSVPQLHPMYSWSCVLTQERLM
jgi:hypothetical protein